MGGVQNMPRLCTLAVGKKYEMLALQLRASLPADIAIYDMDSLSNDAIVFPPKKGFNFNCKRIPIEREYHPDGTLFLDADTTCVDQDTFRLFLVGLMQLQAGIHAVYSYNVYGGIASVHEGIFVSGLSAGNIQKEKLAGKMAFFNDVFPMTEEDLIQMVFPVEWFLFCKFESEQQKNAFFDRWKLLEMNLLGSDMKYLGGECYAIGMAARHAELPIKKLNIKAALNHKNIRTI
jgi:hypothetical protein